MRKNFCLAIIYGCICSSLSARGIPSFAYDVNPDGRSERSDACWTTEILESSYTNSLRDPQAVLRAIYLNDLFSGGLDRKTEIGRALQQQDWPQVARLLDSLLEQHPDVPDFYLARALAAHLSGDQKQAAQSAAQMVKSMKEVRAKMLRPGVNFDTWRRYDRMVRKQADVPATPTKHPWKGKYWDREPPEPELMMPDGSPVRLWPKGLG